MKLLILGGTGGTGRHLVQKALAAGHDVKALVRDPAKANLTHERLTLEKGQATQAADLERVLDGVDAVLSALGPRTSADPVCADTAVALVTAMQKTPVKRLVWLSAGGVGDSLPQLADASFFFAKIILPLALKKPYGNHARAESTITQSTLEWTVARPVQLVDKPTGRPAHAVPIGNGKVQHLKVARADLAAFMLAEVTHNAFVRQLPIIEG